MLSLTQFNNISWRYPLFKTIKLDTKLTHLLNKCNGALLIRKLGVFLVNWDLEILEGTVSDFTGRRTHFSSSLKTFNSQLIFLNKFFIFFIICEIFNLRNNFFFFNFFLFITFLYLFLLSFFLLILFKLWLFLFFFDYFFLYFFNNSCIFNKI